ncbi:MAG TPA: hypothetical protein V6C97_27870 [Oculatellaceae cyanobacterium]
MASSVGASEASFKRVRSTLFNKIRFVATMGRAFTTFTVPSLFPDSPLYDRRQMAQRLLETVREAGYFVTSIDEFTLFIVWADLVTATAPTATSVMASTRC